MPFIMSLADAPE